MKSALIAEWIKSNWEWFWYVVMVLLGGAMDHILSFEKLGRKIPWTNHFWCFVKSWTKAGFIGALMFTGPQLSWGAPPPVCFFLTGIFSAFATDSITWIQRQVKKVIGDRLPGKEENGSQSDTPSSRGNAEDPR